MSVAPLSGLVVLLDEAPLDDLIGAVEVLVQEGITALSLPAEHSGLQDLAVLYGSRARIGVHGPVTAALPEATFALPDQVDEALAVELSTAGIACYAPAMTPTEIRAALRLPVAGVQLYPADVVGPAMGERLQAIGLTERVVPRGGVIAYAAKQWFKAGVPAVCADRALLGDSLRGGDLAALRDRCRSYRN